jgi:glutamate synthase (NADPH) small chain
MVIKNDQHLLRKDPGYREINERLGDYLEVERNLTEEEIKAQAARCLSCGTPFCHGYACPLANVIPETNELVREGRWEEALAILTSTHQFPEFTARICPALCEGSCVLGINDQPVTIRQIEKMIIEKGFAMGWVKPRLPHKRLAETVAVIGSGPAGLAAADRLNQKGYRVAVFEKELSPGGLLLYGIPNFKLDKKVVERRIKLMKEEGIIFECGVTVGLDISYNYLKKRFSALIMTGGTQQPRDIDIPGRELSGIFFATEYLRNQNKVISGELLNSNQKISATAKNVVVIGGGDTGSDCMGTALRQGAGQVYQVEIMPRLPEGRAQNNPWPLWPRIDRISSSHQEGGVRRWSVRPLRFEGDDSGMVKRLHCIEVEWVSKDGQHTPVDKPGTDFSIEADLVLLAMGFLGPGPDPLADVLALQRDSRGNILVDSNHMTSKAGIFSAGDMARGQSLVVQAMADGKAAADHVDLFISSNRNA